MGQAQPVLSVVALLVSIASLLYAIRVNSRVLKVDRLKALAKMQVLARDVQQFENWLTGERVRDSLRFAHDVGWDPSWRILFGQVKDYYSRKDGKLIEQTRECMFQIYRALRGDRVMVNNPFWAKELGYDQETFEELAGRFKAIKVKPLWRLWP